jgi:hypothetical protein
MVEMIYDHSSQGEAAESGDQDAEEAIKGFSCRLAA